MGNANCKSNGAVDVTGSVAATITSSDSESAPPPLLRDLRDIKSLHKIFAPPPKPFGEKMLEFLQVKAVTPRKHAIMIGHWLVHVTYEQLLKLLIEHQSELPWKLRQSVAELDKHIVVGDILARISKYGLRHCSLSTDTLEQVEVALRLFPKTLKNVGDWALQTSLLPFVPLMVTLGDEIHLFSYNSKVLIQTESGVSWIPPSKYETTFFHGAKWQIAHEDTHYDEGEVRFLSLLLRLLRIPHPLSDSSDSFHYEKNVLHAEIALQVLKGFNEQGILRTKCVFKCLELVVLTNPWEVMDSRVGFLLNISHPTTVAKFELLPKFLNSCRCLTQPPPPSYYSSLPASSTYLDGCLENFRSLVAVALSKHPGELGGLFLPRGEHGDTPFFVACDLFGTDIVHGIVGQKLEAIVGIRDFNNYRDLIVEIAATHDDDDEDWWPDALYFLIRRDPTVLPSA